MLLSLPSSDVTQQESDTRVVVEAWDWDRYTANDFIGGFSISVGEILQTTERKEHWYKLLDEKQTKERYERVLEDAEVQQVQGTLGYKACSIRGMCVRPGSCRILPLCVRITLYQLKKQN